MTNLTKFMEELKEQYDSFAEDGHRHFEVFTEDLEKLLKIIEIQQNALCVIEKWSFHEPESATISARASREVEELCQK